MADLSYNVKIEVLRNDLGSSEEKVSNIAFDGVTIGDCNPDGEDYDCTFFDCTETLNNATVSSSKGYIIASFTYAKASSKI